MTSRAAGQSGSRSRKGFAYDPQRITVAGENPAVVRESAAGLAKNEKIESLLTDSVSRLDRIEEKIDENVYPPRIGDQTGTHQAAEKSPRRYQKRQGKNV